MSTVLQSLDSHPQKCDRHDRLTRILHWIFAFSIIYTMIAGYSLHVITNKSIFHFISTLNMSIATCLIILFPVRYVWSIVRIDPKPIESIPARQRAIAHAAHSLTYALIAFVLLSGFVMIPDGYWFFGAFYVKTPFSQGPITDHWFTLHRIACYTLTVMVIAHVGAAIKHHLILKNDTLKRML